MAAFAIKHPFRSTLCLNILGSLVLLCNLALSNVLPSLKSLDCFTLTNGEEIPNFAANPTLTSTRSGDWNNPSTWNAGRTPNVSDVVVIQMGHTVTISNNASSRTTAIDRGGRLTFAANVNTRWEGVTLLVMPGGELIVGTEANPIAANVTAEIVITDYPLDLANDPAQFSNGLLAVNGLVRMHGAVKNPTFVRLGAEPYAGQSSLSASTAVSGWRNGDRLIIPDTRRHPGDVTYVPQWEEPTLQAASGANLQLSGGLAFDHYGIRNPDGVIDILPHVGNLSRNIVVRSQNPYGVRGHTLYTQRSDIDIRYVLFKDLGRTTNAPLDDVSNRKGRYPVHAHFLTGPLTPQANGYQFTLKGNAIADSEKWPMAVHSSHYGLVQDNVIYNGMGAGLSLEDGSESYNVVERNFVVRIDGTGERFHEGRDGSGFWFRGPNSYVRHNVAANINRGGGPYSYLYIYDQRYVGPTRVPTYQGADTYEAGGYNVTDTYAQPVREFLSNEGYGATSNGLSLIWVGTEFFTTKAQQESVVKDFVVGNVTWLGIFGYETHKLVLDGMKARNGGTAYLGGDYFNSEITFRNLDVQGFWVGIDFTTISNGEMVVENSYFRNYTSLFMGSSNWVGCSAEGLPPRTVVARNVRFDAMPGQGLNAIALDPQQSMWPWGTVNLRTRNAIKVYDYNGVPGDDFEVYSWEQAPDFIMPQNVRSPFFDENPNCTWRLFASPDAGLTNAQNWAQHGIAINGAVAPCSDTRNGIRGFACGGSEPPTQASLSIAKAGTGSGTVTSGDGRIDCGSSCSATYPLDSVVSLLATADEGSSFAGWSGSGCGESVVVDQSRTCTAIFNLQSGGENQPPVAQFTANPTSDEPPLRVAFDARSSYDPDGSIVSYRWDFGDGRRGTGRRVSHTYRQAGVYVASLTVTDNLGATATASMEITVGGGANSWLELPVGIHGQVYVSPQPGTKGYVTSIDLTYLGSNANAAQTMTLKTELPDGLSATWDKSSGQAYRAWESVDGTMLAIEFPNARRSHAGTQLPRGSVIIGFPITKQIVNGRQFYRVQPDWLYIWFAASEQSSEYEVGHEQVIVHQQRNGFYGQ